MAHSCGCTSTDVLLIDVNEQRHHWSSVLRGIDKRELNASRLLLLDGHPTQSRPRDKVDAFWLRSRLRRVDHRVRVVNAPAKVEALQCAVGGVANIERDIRT